MLNKDGSFTVDDRFEVENRYSGIERKRMKRILRKLEKKKNKEKNSKLMAK